MFVVASLLLVVFLGLSLHIVAQIGNSHSGVGIEWVQIPDTHCASSHPITTHQRRRMGWEYILHLLQSQQGDADAPHVGREGLDRQMNRVVGVRVLHRSPRLGR